jgi:hypothetical protein
VLEPLEAPELPAAIHEAIHNEVRQHKYSITNPSLKHSQLSVYALLIETYFRPGRRRENSLCCESHIPVVNPWPSFPSPAAFAALEHDVC